MTYVERLDVKSIHTYCVLIPEIMGHRSEITESVDVTTMFQSFRTETGLEEK